ncbi:MAG: molybdopterin binding protein [Fusobacteria bacterium]|nr:MAG: molybdopterin binding protein [Fusobacteriota bacterium]KAF0228844.1 MAG: molybdopterin binding [Fusobacteriota bacterium]
MKIIAIEEAVGKQLSHELTGIVPGNNQNITYLRGYVVKAEDVEILKNMGKYHVKIIDEDSKLIHENEAAKILGTKACGNGVTISEPKEGKVHGFADHKGILLTSRKKLKSLNMIDGMKVATKKKYSIVEAGSKVATFSITPLEIEQELLETGVEMLKEPIVEVYPINSLKIGVVTTGREVYEGRIKDAFLPYLQGMLETYGYQVMEQNIVPDEQSIIRAAVDDFIERDFDLVVLTGGMSVDADDFTLKTVKEHEKVEMVIYGSPVFPGAMFMAAYYEGKIPLIGLPAGLLRGGMSILDLVLPLLVAKIKITKNFIAELGDGGLL